MKRLTCEMCGSTDLIKENGVFVCQSCGCKYSVEEAKKMMVEGTVEVTGTVSIDNQKKLSNLRELAQRAREAGDSKTASLYYSQLLLEDPSDWAANFYSVYYDAHNIRLGEIAIAANRVGSILDTVFRLIREEQDSNIRKHIEENGDPESINVTVFEQTCKSKARTAYIVICTDVKKFCFQMVDNALNLGNAYAALNAIIPAYHMLIQSGDAVVKYFHDYDFALKIYSSVGWSLVAELAKISRTSHERDLRKLVDSRIAQVKRLEQEETIRREQERQVAEQKKQQERNEIYWSEHAAEKQALEQEKAELTVQIEALKAEQKQKLAKLEKEKNEVPGWTEIAQLANQITQLMQEREALGFFKMKEKKTLTAKIEALEKIQQQERDVRTALQNEVQARITAASTEFASVIHPYQTRLNSIHDELTKDR